MNRFRGVRQKFLRYLSNLVMVADGTIYLRGPSFGTVGRFHKKFAIDLSKLEGLRIWYPISPDIRGGEIDIISAFPSGRLGNRIFELAIGMGVAGVVLARNFNMIVKASDADEGIFPQVSAGLPIRHWVRTKKTSLRLQGSFGSQTRPILIQGSFLAIDPLVFPDYLDLMAKSFSVMRNSTEADRLLPISPLGTPECVVHFRGTDRLTSAQDRDFRPPPLAFFLRAVESEGVCSVKIVTEDPESSLVEELLRRFQNSEIIATVSHGSLEEDLALMLSARVLILSGSSLSDSAAGLSSRLQKIHMFERATVTRTDVEVFHWYDKSGSWEARYNKLSFDSPLPVAELMSNFPAKNIAYNLVQTSPS